MELVGHCGVSLDHAVENIGVLGRILDPPLNAYYVIHILFSALLSVSVSNPYYLVCKENHFDEFVSKNGGYSNAYTDTYQTVYYFSVLINPSIKVLELGKQSDKFLKIFRHR